MLILTLEVSFMKTGKLKMNPIAYIRSCKGEVVLNMVGVTGICIALLVAYYYQLGKMEMPCPLCLLQRVGLIMIGCGFFYNVRFGIRPAHYGVVVLGSVITGLFAGRHISLHVTPGDIGYGSTLFGLHLYTWGLIASVLTIIWVALIMIAGNQNDVNKNALAIPLWCKFVISLFTLLIALNVISTVLECGAGACPANPTYYQLLR